MPLPLIPGSLRKGVKERIAADGSVVTPIDLDGAASLVGQLKADGVEAVAVSFLHSFSNPSHERSVKALIEEIAPELFVSISSDVNPEIREFERTSTTVANVFVKPVMKQYLSRFREELFSLGLEDLLFVMLSSGGVTTCRIAEEFPVRVIESGPAAGAIAAAWWGKHLSREDLISFDMGGTTAKACFIHDSKPLTANAAEVARLFRFKKGSGISLRVPVIDLIEIGAGGGSIASVDRMGLMKVGPESAGADPGPACYGRGGEEPTVTDADLVLGYLNPGYFLGGEMRLDVGRAEEAIRKSVAAPLGLDVERAAWGIHQIVNENMVNAVRVHAAEKGIDFRRHGVIAFGGAGPIHAHRIAESLALETVICPLSAGVMSAMGLLVAPFAFHIVRTHKVRLAAWDARATEEIYREMEEEARGLMAHARLDGERIGFRRSADMRYQGQNYDINVPLEGSGPRDWSADLLLGSFEREYRRLYQRHNPDIEVEVLNWRLEAVAREGSPPLKSFERKSGRTESALKGERDAYFPESGGFTATKVYDRYALFPGAEVRGPAIVEERESTVVAGPSSLVTIDDHLNLILTLGGRRGA
ncbi:MAG: hydantoinase/oxoprolinase family protein, partial [Nitrospinota bacterium]|nr:hydantoinase/oxoprolinase family protein [Nitrospinota bacterium]